MSNSLPTSQQISRADELMGLLCDGQIAVEQVCELDQLVVQFPQIRRGYVELMSLHSDLRQQAALLKPQDSTDSSALNAIADQAAHQPRESNSESESSTPDVRATRSDLNETFILPAIDADSSTFEEAAAIDLPKLPPSPPAHKRFALQMAAGILLPLFAVGLFWAIHARPKAGPSRSPVARLSPGLSTDPACIIDLAIDARWADTIDSVPAAGATLAPGVHNLSSGLIKLELPGNAIMVIESPALFQILASNKIQIRQGKLCALMINGGGLTVITPDLTAVDMGTEFAVDVTPGKQTHLEVLQGQVKAAPVNLAQGEVYNNVVAGEAVVVAAGSTAIQADTPRPLAFVRPSQVQAGDETSYQRWVRFSQVIRQDPDLSAYYPFDNESATTNRLENRAKQTAGNYTGILGAMGVAGSNPTWAQGRWPGKSALQFGGAQLTAVTINAQPELIPKTALTLCLWIKHPDLTRPLHLLAGEAEGKRSFNLGIIRKDTTDAVNRLNSTWSQFNALSAPADFKANQWEFVAVASTVATGTQFYLNGKLVSANKNVGSVPVSVNQLLIGAPFPGSKLSDPNEFFNGSMDELMIYRRALSAEEIEHLFKMGSPD